MANGSSLGPGLTSAQRHYRNGGKEKRNEWRKRPEVRERLRIRQRAWRAANPKKVKEQADKYREVHGEKRKQLGREANWRRKGYPEPTRPRPATCDICGNPPRARCCLHLDHDHATNKFRGWLCVSCNSGLGNFRDSSKRLRLALAYLSSHETAT